MKIYNVCWGTFKVLCWAFVFSVMKEWKLYNPVENSAPFYVIVLTKCALWLLAAGIMFVRAKYFKKNKM